MEPDVHISTTEAARLVGVNPKTIRRWITVGRLPAEKDAAGNYLVRPEEVLTASDNPGQRPVLRPIVRRDQQPLDMTPLLARLEELTRENERLKAQIEARDALALAAGDHSPWYDRLLFWRKDPHTHVS